MTSCTADTREAYYGVCARESYLLKLPIMINPEEGELPKHSKCLDKHAIQEVDPRRGLHIMHVNPR